MDERVVTVHARFRDRRWELLLPGTAKNPWGPPPSRFASLEDLFDLASECLADASEDGDTEHLSAQIVMNDPHCPIGRHGSQTLVGVLGEPGPGWHEHAVEHVVTHGDDGAYGALHQVTYDVNGDARFSSIRLAPTAITWAFDHLRP